MRGFLNILELAKDKKIRTIYASSSSIYGDQKKFPIKENFIGIQKNLYASTKNINEELAKIYNKSFDIPIMGLRFFTVYGEWGRPDMLYLKYLNAIKKNKTIYLYNFGKHTRDFTYISDVIEILVKLVKVKDKKYYQNNIFNICSGKPINLITYLKFIDKIYGKNCKIKKITKQKIEIIKTHGSNTKIKKLVKKRNLSIIKMVYEIQ